MRINGIEIGIYKDVLRRRSEDTRYSHFAGTPDELKRTTLLSWHNANFRPSNLAGMGSTYLVTVGPQNFFAMNGARLVSERRDYCLEPRWEKKPAARAEVVVRIVQRSPTGAVEKLEIIDIQAYPATTLAKARSEAAAQR